MRALKILAAGIAVYLGVAACSAASSTQERLAQAGGTAGATAQPGGAGGAPGGSGGMATGGAGGSVLDSGLDAFADAMGDAMTVPDADAAPVPLVVTAQCDIAVDTNMFAEAPFPGKLSQELAGVRALANYAATITSGALDYKSITAPYVYVADGRVAVNCGTTLNHADTVDFILP